MKKKIFFRKEIFLMIRKFDYEKKKFYGKGNLIIRRKYNYKKEIIWWNSFYILFLIFIINYKNIF